jgi:hypothetical protein
MTQPRDVELRAAWRDGHEAGERDGASDFVASDAMTAIALELTITRLALERQCKRADYLRAQHASACRRVVELARLLDSVSPDWDRR